MPPSLPITPSLIIVTGISGSGKTTALKTLEDLGCEVMDNIPLSLCYGLVLEKNPASVLAVGIDIRTRGFNPQNFTSVLEDLKKIIRVSVLFFEASSAALENRYRETRRAHPFGSDVWIGDQIEKERLFLEPIRQNNLLCIDTTYRSPPELKSHLQHTLNLLHPRGTTVYLMSFAYRRGIPQSADFVFDMRFLPNPFYDQGMKNLTGQSLEVQDFFEQQEPFTSFITPFFPLLDRMLSGGRPSFVLAFGCSGGRHRSVYMAEKTSLYLESQGYVVHTHHRDLT